jgi:hypothetical protein
VLSHFVEQGKLWGREGEDLMKDLNALALFLNRIQSEPSIASKTTQISCEVDYIWIN